MSLADEITSILVANNKDIDGEHILFGLRLSLMSSQKHCSMSSKTLLLENIKKITQTWPFIQPPATMLGLDGLNWKHRISSGASSNNLEIKFRKIRIKCKQNWYIVRCFSVGTSYYTSKILVDWPDGKHEIFTEKGIKLFITKGCIGSAKLHMSTKLGFISTRE